jgi:alanine racemase
VPVRALARVNLAAIERNVRRLRETLRPGTEMCVVVKADAYGHGAAPVARAAQAAGATWLAVASAQEAAQLRQAGLEGPLLVMGAISHEELPLALVAEADVVAWTVDFVRAVAGQAAGLPREHRGGARAPVGVHVKLDTGMGRFGTRDLEEALNVAGEVSDGPDSVSLRGAMTHLATADDDPEFLAVQLARFEPFVDHVRARWPEVLVHAANSAGVLRGPKSHFDLVRCGIAVYGCNPMGREPEEWNLDPALELTSYVAAVKSARPGDSVGYGRTFRAQRETRIATVPIGYADGYARALSNRSDVLVAGSRRPVVGTISMDNLTVDLGVDSSAKVGDRVTLIGSDGPERQTDQGARRPRRWPTGWGRSAGRSCAPSRSAFPATTTEMGRPCERHRCDRGPGGSAPIQLRLVAGGRRGSGSRPGPADGGLRRGRQRRCSPAGSTGGGQRERVLL